MTRSRWRRQRIAQLPLKASVGKRRGRGLLITDARIERSDFLNFCQYSRIRAESHRFNHCACEALRSGGMALAIVFIE